MNGPTLTMAPAVERVGSFHRSHSTPDLLSLSTLAKPAPSLSSATHKRGLGLKSLPSLPDFDIPLFESDPNFDTTLFLDGKGLTSRQDEATVTQAEAVHASQVKTQKAPDRGSPADRPKSWLLTSKSVTNIRDLIAERSSYSVERNVFVSGSTGLSESEPADRPRTVSESFASFARRSWMSTSRSPSPQRNRKDIHDVQVRDRVLSQDSGIGPKSSRKRPVSILDSEHSRSSDSLSGRTRALSRATTYLTKIKQRPQSVLVRLGSGGDSDTSCASSATSLAPPTSDAHSSVATSSESNTSALDDELATSRSRDPLSMQFRDLESDFAKLGSKTTSQRMGLVRTSLMTFLSSYENSSAVVNNGLYPEDIERRANVLNKWWNGLLDMLDGKGQQPLAGVDRPTLLEAATMIMMRPEWRMTTSYFLPLADRSPAERVRARSYTQSTTSSELSSSEAAFLAESAEHNVRTMFVQNLLAQMSLVVDKISLRHAPLSLVHWAGKACAYAFFFAPGVAEVLVRLWGLNLSLIQRTADEFGLPRRSKGESEDIVALFPPSLGSLGWSSVKDIANRMRQNPKLPVVAAKIQWQGPWVSRWLGRDTDLFFVFCKYYHILADKFMPSELPLVERARAPAFVLVHAQLLATMDATVHRQAAADTMFSPMSPLADAFGGADASATSMPLSVPLSPTNLLKGMAESRLILLLKDVLSPGIPDMGGAQHTFAEAFGATMKASARRTSMFDHTACFTLCDFLEEAVMVYDAHEDPTRPDAEYIDWPFWFEVCRKILDSLNTTSEIRMLALIFAIWDVVAADSARKEALCLEWLLTEETFDKYFNNWCPMVRAYYMRLLCWRICRDTGSAKELDAKIFCVVSKRLKTVWSHYLYLKFSSETSGKVLPSTAPVLPAPGKKFMIIRTEVNAPQPGLFMGFDSFSQGLNAESDGSSPSDDVLNSKSDGKKRWSLLGKVLSLTASTTASEKPTWDEQLETARRETATRAKPARELSGPPLPPLPPKPNASRGMRPTSDGSSTGSSPTFEPQQYVFKFVLSFVQNLQPRDRILTRPRLPSPAQSWVSARAKSGSPQPPPAGLPAPTRRYSGLPQTGLINEARNASPLGAPAPGTAMPRASFHSNFSRPFSLPADASLELQQQPGSGASSMGTVTPTDERERTLAGEALTLPVKPGGIYKRNAIYAGRALAEWSVVVNECNNFIERRRDEGVLGLSDVEVPFLGVDGLRRIG